MCRFLSRAHAGRKLRMRFGVFDRAVHRREDMIHGEVRGQPRTPAEFGNRAVDRGGIDI